MYNNNNNRIELIDVIRGFCVIIIVIYHFLFDLAIFGFIPTSIIENLNNSFFTNLIAGTFIVICGISCYLSHNNQKRGLKLAILALIITITTYIYNSNFYIVWGIIHFLSFSVLTFNQNLFEKFKFNNFFPLILSILFIIFKQTISTMRFDISGLSIFGFTSNSFNSLDYFPIFPWLFLFYIGVYLGKELKNGNFSDFVYTFNIKFLSSIGKKSLLIYLLHQPILYGLIFIYMYMKG